MTLCNAEHTAVHIVRCKAPSWMSQDVHDQMRRQGTYEVRFSAAERKVLRKRKKIRVSEWSERHRRLTMSSMPGPWRNETTPYLTGIMDAAGETFVQRVIVCKAPQVGVSECCHNFVGWCIDRNPGPVLYVYPDEDTARENSQDRILPMIRSSQRLSTYLTGAKDDESVMRINMQHMPIYLAWARSAARLGNKPIKDVIFDEVDKYPLTANKKEASPIALGEKRTLTYRWRRTIWKISTPTVESGVIWQALQHEAQVVFAFWVRCPLCAGWQLMEFDRIKWPEGERDPVKIEAGKQAWYICGVCGGQWDDQRRDQAVQRGEWRAQATGENLDAYLMQRRPQNVGFHLPSWISPFVSLSEVAGAFLKGIKDKVALRDFMNNHKAEPWVDYQVERSEDRILALRDDRPRGQVPGGGVVAELVFGADVQDSGLWYEIRAFGYGPAQDSWQIREGFLAKDSGDFESLAQLLWEDTYQDPDGIKYVVKFGLIDAMGHRTQEVYDWCLKYRGRVYPLQGDAQRKSPYAFFDVYNYPGTKRKLPGRLQRINIDTNYYKNLLSSRLAIAPGDPGAWRLHAETTEDWARQLCAEYVNDHGLWEVVPHRANHGWDCSVYALAAADVRNIRHRTRPGAAPPSKVQPPPKRAQAGTRPNWLERR